MQKKIITIIFLTVTILTSAYADPWFATGPFMSNSGYGEALGESSLSVNMDDNINYGTYGAQHDFIKSPRYYDSDLAIQYAYGLTSKVDIHANVTYTQNKNSGSTYEHIGDTVFAVGYQVLSQTSKYNSTLRARFGLILPTGKYQNLRPLLKTTDATGAGSYQPAIGLIFKHQFIFNDENYLNFYASTDLRYAHKVRINGLSAYGGSTSTRGVIRPGNSLNFDLAAELSLSKQLAIIFECYIYLQQPSSFNGKVSDDLASYLIERRKFAGLESHRRGPPRIRFNPVQPTIHTQGNPLFIGSGSVVMLTLSPAVEYSINDNFGILAGAWISTPGGSNTMAFVSPMLSFVASWG
jgi:hypothetical protein